MSDDALNMFDGFVPACEISDIELALLLKGQM